MDEMEALRREIGEAEKLIEALRKTPAQTEAWEECIGTWVRSLKIIASNQIGQLEKAIAAATVKLQALEGHN